MKRCQWQETAKIYIFLSIDSVSDWVMVNDTVTIQPVPDTIPPTNHDRVNAVVPRDGLFSKPGRRLTVCSVVALLLLLACRFTALSGPMFLSESVFLMSETILLGIIGAVYFLLPPEQQRNDPPLLLAISAFGTIATAVAITTQGGTTLPDSWVVVLTIFSLSYACPRILRNQDYLNIFQTIVLVLFAHSLFSVWLAMTGTQSFLCQEIATASARCTSLFGPVGAYVTGLTFNTNTLAIYLLFIPSLLILLERNTQSQRKKVAMRVLLCAALLHLGATLSRAAILAVASSFALWIAIRKRSSSATKVIFWSLSAPIGTSILVAAVLATQDPSMLLRYHMWCDAIDLIAKQPWGYGVSAWNLEYIPHSFFLGTALNFGLAGLLAMISVTGLLIRSSLPQVRNDSAKQLILLTVLCAIVIHGSMEYFIGQPAHFANALFWLLLGYLGLKNISPSEDLTMKR